MAMDFERENILNHLRENRFTALAVVLIALLLFGYLVFILFSIVPRWQQRADLLATIATVESVTTDRTAQQQSVAGQISQQIETAQVGFDQQVNRFLTEAQAVAFLAGLYDSAAATAVSVVDLQAQTVPQSDTIAEGKPVYDVRRFHLVAEGKLPDLNTFVGHLKQTAVASINLQNLLVATGEAGLPDVLTVDLLLYTSPYSTGESVADLPDLVATPAATAAPLPSPAPVTSPTPDMSGLTTQLDNAWADENWPEAIRLIQEIRQEIPSEPGMTEKLYAARVNYGYQLAGLGQKELAIEQFEQALAIFPQGSEAEAGLQSLFAPAPTATPSTTIYVVQHGDTLFSIARRYGSSVDAVKAANGLVNNNIVPGQQLVIP